MVHIIASNTWVPLGLLTHRRPSGMSFLYNIAYFRQYIDYLSFSTIVYKSIFINKSLDINKS